MTDDLLYTSDQKPTIVKSTAGLTNDFLRLETANGPRDWEGIVDRLLTVFPRLIPVTAYFKGKKNPAFAGWRDPVRTPASSKYWDRDYQEVRKNKDGVEFQFRGDGYYNIGVPIDEGTDFVVFDLDRKNGKDGLRALIDVCKDIGITLPVTFTVHTPSGGLHLYFRTKKRWTNRADIFCKNSGIDMRSVGTWVMAPGSRLEKINGDEIETIFYSVARPVEMADLPVELETALDRDQAKKQEQQILKSRHVAPIDISKLPPVEKRIEDARNFVERFCPVSTKLTGDGGNKKIFRASCALTLDFALSVDQALPILEEWNNRCTPPWTKSELVSTLTSASVYAPNSVGNAYAEEVEEECMFDMECLNDSGPTSGPVFLVGDHEEIAQDIFMRYNGKLVFDEGHLYEYNGVNWERLDDYIIRNKAAAYSGTFVGGKKPFPIRIKDSDANGIVKRVKDKARKPNFFQASSGIGFKNGFVRFVDGAWTLESHDPKHNCRFVLPFDYDEKARCPNWDALLDTNIDDPTAQKVLKMWHGASLAGRATQYKSHIIFLGESNAGKSPVMDVIEASFPEETRTAVSMHQMSERFTKWKLHNKLLNCVQELPAKDMLETEEIKKVCTGNTVMAEQKGKDVFEFKPIAGHLFGANALPHNPEKSKAIRNRYHIIKFNKIFSTHPKEGELKADTKILQSIMPELPGIIVSAMKAFVELYKADGYPVIASSEEAHDEWERESNPVKQFAHDFVTVSGSEFHVVEDFWDSFEQWTLKYKTGQRIKFGTFVKEFKAIHSANYERTSKHRGYQGLKIKPVIPQTY